VRQSLQVVHTRQQCTHHTVRAWYYTGVARQNECMGDHGLPRYLASVHEVHSSAEGVGGWGSWRGRLVSICWNGVWSITGADWDVWRRCCYRWTICLQANMVLLCSVESEHSNNALKIVRHDA
jgi:hypothetical protein